LDGRVTDLDLAALRSAYAADLSAADPLLPEPAELPAGDDLLVARVGDSVAAGALVSEELDPDSLYATWGALRQHRLRVQVAGPDPAAALDALLDRWDEHLAATAPRGDRECAAIITWPSRHTAAVPALTMHGFGPAVTVAARTADREHGGPPADGLTVRPLRHDDLDVVTPLYMQVIEYDERFGMVNARPATADRLRQLLAGLLDRDAMCAWIAVRDGAPLGLCYVDLPGHTEWIATMSRLSPIAYLGCLVVDRDVRSAGVGSLLAAQAHRAAAMAGAAVTLLHHAVPNPLSTPFWYRHGYRPLWTAWQRRPALR
jgi:GNAT superfamily N-acetyltransferase